MSDELHEEAKIHVIETQRASISSLQRKFKIGYNRACRIMEDLEKERVVSAIDMHGARRVVAKPVHDEG